MSVRFVRLGITGFKSFADTTSIEIMPGLTGIVGPNGCGKSNVAEALRWAMGEANARTLRGAEMNDVIFAGSSDRPSRNLAEVSLTIEDDGAALPPPFTGQREVQIARRLERGAGSAYRVNGRETRARDVQTLFADLASGARSSAMVSQGRVGSLVNARPEERRAVLEEAAGTSGLHARRAEAEMRLRATDANLQLAEERGRLLEQQLEGLRKQAKQAARYRTVMMAVLEAEANVLALELARSRAAQAASEAGLASSSEALHQATTAAVAGGAEADRVQASLPGLRQSEAAARSERERAQAARQVLAAEAARRENERASAQQRQAQIARDLAHAETGLREAEQSDVRLAGEIDRLGAEAAAHPGALATAQEEAERAATALREADQVVVGAAAAAVEAAARLGAMQQVLRQAEQRAKRAQEEQARLTAARTLAAGQSEDTRRLEAARDALAVAEDRLAQCRAAQENAETERNLATEALGPARERHAGLDAVYRRVAAETSALVEVLGVKDGERWPPLIDRLVVPSGFEAALGAVLGEELAAAEDPSAARHWRALPALPHEAVAGQPLAEVVEAPPLLGRALSGIGLVQSEAEGEAQQRFLKPGQALVSKDGAVWRWDGYTIRAGTPTAAAVRLQQRNRLSALRARLAATEAERHTAQAAWKAAEQRDQQARKLDQEARTAFRTAQPEVERARATVQSLGAQVDAATARLAALDQQLASLAPELQSATEALAAAQQEAAALPDSTALRRAAEQGRAAVAVARSRDVAAGRALDAVQRAHQARQSRLVSIEQDRVDRRARIADLGGRITDLTARALEAAGDLDRLPKPGQAVQEAARAQAAFVQAERVHTDALQAREEAERRATAVVAEARRLEHAVFAAREALARGEEIAAAARQARQDTEARVAERAPALPAFVTPADLSAGAEDRARARLQRLTRERDEMGPVNLRAEIEAQLIETDMATITRERDELGTAIAKLRGSIGHLNREGREKLTAVFQEVDRHFQALFTRMFGGGRAHLALVGSDDPLEAGLEIYAQPPGKKLSMLSLLSGGEQALTALSLIFAVFRCNPAPLCVLDEVDAPLDDANVERLCNLLTDMALETGTRFLVVTHHQVTMARMDRLYGVTMQERGVSRLLSVDLSRAVELIEAIAAE